MRPGALILGCTHYPLLEVAIGKLMGPDTQLISSGLAAAVEVKKLIAPAEMLGNAKTGELHCYTTDNPQRFVELGERFGGRTISHVKHIGTDELENLPQNT